MRIDADPRSGAACPNPVTSSAANASAAAPSAPDAAPADRIDDRAARRPVADAADPLRAWVKNQWPTLAGAAHGLASAPGVVSHAWLEASRANAGIASQIDALADGWERIPPSRRQAAIETLRRTAGTESVAARAVASALAQANRLPLARETADEIAHPPFDRLPPDVEAGARDVAFLFARAASSQAARASSVVHTISRTVGATLADVHAHLAHVPRNEVRFANSAVVRDIPVAGYALAATGTFADIAHGLSPVDAAVANVGSLAAGTAGGALVQAGASRVASALFADAIGSAAAGVVGASAPELALVGLGVVAASVIGYGVSSAVESGPGRALIDGAARRVRWAAAAAVGE